MTENPIIAVAGVGGDLGNRIARALVARGAQVRALVRPDTPAPALAEIKRAVGEVTPADPEDVAAMCAACRGAACVVSALNGVREVMIGRQGVLLEAALRSGVPRFIPSDFSADFTKTRPGKNRNFDLRREFMARIDGTPIRATSIFNGAFMDMLGREMPLIQPKIRRVLYFHDADQPLDFTTKDDVAAYVAAAALDVNAPRILRIAGDCVSARDLAAVMTTVSGERYRTLWLGSLGVLGLVIETAKIIAPQPGNPFPPWQGMQYLRDQFSGRAKLSPLDNDRYPGLSWRSVRTLLSERQKEL